MKLKKETIKLRPFICLNLKRCLPIIPGELHVPLEVCGAVVMRELDFWQVDQHVIKACCWRHYRSYIENKRILDSFQRSLKKETFSVDVSKFEGWKKFQMQMWLILEHPRTSKLAMVSRNNTYFCEFFMQVQNSSI